MRFELTDGFPSPVFKTGAFSLSATLPILERVVGFEPASIAWKAMFSPRRIPAKLGDS